MSLVAQLEGEIRAYLAGQRSLDDLEDWLAAHVIPIAAATDVEARSLSDWVWILLSEYDYGHRSEQSVRAELAAELAQRARRAPPAPVPTTMAPSHWSAPDAGQPTSTGQGLPVTGPSGAQRDAAGRRLPPR